MAKVYSYNGWEASKDPSAIGVNKNFAPLGHRYPQGVKSGDVEMVFTALVLALDAEVEDEDLPGALDEWGYLFKNSANSPLLLSCHASATALDYNATRHPNGKRRTYSRAQAAKVNEILDRLRTNDGVRVVQWRALVEDGGCANSAPDEMHFEIAKVTAAQVKQVADRLRDLSKPPAPTPTPNEDEDDMEMFLLTWTKDGQIWLRQGDQYTWIPSAPYYYEMCRLMPDRGFNKPTVIDNSAVWHFMTTGKPLT